MRIPEWHNTVYRALEPYRRLTSAGRDLPQVVIGGAQKCGTSYLAGVLAAQGTYYVPPTKEIHFYSGFWDRGTDWYAAHFPRRSSGTVGVDASPTYMIHAPVPQRIRETRPDARLIFLLRDPVARAHSHHRHNVTAGLETLGLEEALAAEGERTAADVAALAQDPAALTRHLALYGYRERGHYARYLQRFLDVFPREQVLVLDSALFFRHDPDEVALLEAFLGTEIRSELAAEACINKGTYDGEEAEARAGLRAHYRLLDDHLAEVAGRRLSWMT